MFSINGLFECSIKSQRFQLFEFKFKLSVNFYELFILKLDLLFSTIFDESPYYCESNLIERRNVNFIKVDQLKEN